ncbi:ATP-dependent DNA helicase PIF1 [Leptopilina heterotoma]|uniref:ATP-dependent DNA helicase PIF1 n=1 Tax=Leptopilina heterotoma TaxID=63436 RepID=UPI001CA8EAA1|nr:ATP-dependent DNA helicase PIF1 [Leptopilina heterotoma]
MSQEAEGCFVTCTTRLEWLNNEGCIKRKVDYKTATTRLIRNNIREMLIEVRSEKTNTTIKLILRGISVFNRFMSEGKASIKFQEEKCTLYLSNAPVAQLVNFLKTLFVKMTGQTEKATKISAKEKMLSNVMGSVTDISPSTVSELNKAKEKAGTISRATLTTPSPKSVLKRKSISENALKIPKAKKLNLASSNIEMTEEQKNVLDAILAGRNVFFTGSAGTGKSYLLKKIINALPPNVTMPTASTGVAACHIGGITLHQFCGIGIGTASIENCCKIASKSTASSLWRKTKHLIIDEISMIDADYFEKIEAVARYIRRNEKPFGGIQIILCGDFFQLPPVSKRDDKAKFCFQSKKWSECVQANFELKIVHRQKDSTFVNILNSIRIGRVTEEITTKLKSTTTQKIESNGILATRLCTHINEANELNNSQLEKLSGEQKVFIAEDSDNMMTKTLDQQLPVPSKLILKVGAQVMLLKNINVSGGLVNGARGVVIKFLDDYPVIQFRSGGLYHAKMETWGIKTASGGSVQRKQIPCKLAWAFSIHKSQGLTLDCVEMSLTRVFDAGQAYVALSRAQSLETLRVLNFDPKQVWANPIVLEFYKNFRRRVHDMQIIRLGRKANSVC